jgi:cleavage and polyadenylation specificity factor subunit 2
MERHTLTLYAFGVVLQGSTGSQQIVIEGPLCEDYYKIREHLYSQFYLL